MAGCRIAGCDRPTCADLQYCNNRKEALPFSADTRSNENIQMSVAGQIRIMHTATNMLLGKVYNTALSVRTSQSSWIHVTKIGADKCAYDECSQYKSYVFWDGQWALSDACEYRKQVPLN